MRLVDLLNESLIDADFSARGKEDAIARLMDRLVAGGKVPESARPIALKAVMDRERSLSTGMEHGIAIPHGSIDELEEMACAFGISPSGVEFSCVDGAPARLILLLVIPRRKFSRHVQTLAGIARLLNHAGMRQRLASARTPGEVLRILQEEEGKEAV